MERIREQDLKQPDLFVTEVSIIWKWAHKHQKTLGIILGIFVVGGVGFSLYEMYDGSHEQKAQEALFVAMNKYEKQHEAFEKAEKPPKAPAKPGAEQEEEEPNDPSVAAMKATGDFEKDYGSIVAELEKVARTQQGTRASIVAAITAAQIYRDYSKFDQGLKLLSDIEPKAPKNSVLRGGLILNKGDFYQAKGECDKAIAEWNPLVTDPKFGFLQSEAMLREALCYKVTGQTDKSAELLRKLTQEKDLSNTRAGQAAKKYLRLQSDTPAKKG